MGRRTVLSFGFTAIFVGAVFAAGPTFRPDVVFRGNALTGWTPLGQADWRAQNGEIVGTPKQPGGGWLVLNKSYQDVAVYTNVTCPAGCKAGVLLRAEKTPDGGMKGVYVSLTEGDLSSYAVTLDAQGVEKAREQLPTGRAGGAAVAAAAGAAAAGAAGGGGGRGAAAGARCRARRRRRRGATTPAGRGWRGAAVRGAARRRRCRPASNLPGLMSRPAGGVQARPERTASTSRWPTTRVTVRWNGGSLGAAGGNADFALGKYGPIALYVGGTGSATLQGPRVRRSDPAAVRRGEDVAELPRAAAERVLLRLLGGDRRHQPRRQHGRRVRARTSTSGPTSRSATSSTPASATTRRANGRSPSMVNLAYDWTGDGWPDVLNMSGNAGNGTGTLYVNPKGESRRWDHRTSSSSACRQRRDAPQGRRRRRQARADPLRQQHAALLQARSGEPDRHVDHDDDLGAGTVGREHRPRHGHRRHQRRRPQ